MSSPTLPMKRNLNDEKNLNKKRNRNRSKKNKNNNNNNSITLNDFNSINISNDISNDISNQSITNDAIEMNDDNNNIEENNPQSSSHITDELFIDLPLTNTVKTALNNMKLYNLTQIQSLTFTPISQGNDVLAKAKTGTGKTLAFLLPLLNNLISSISSHSHDLSSNITTASPLSSLISSNFIPFLVVSPTRELATQISTQAVSLLKNTKYSNNLHQKVVTLYGGVNKKKDLVSLSYDEIFILITTPGRLIDHLYSTPSFRERLNHLRTLILDECDLLLNHGFKKDIEKIFSYLPKDRQTLLFSATIPHDIINIVNTYMKKSYQFINAIKEEEDNNNDNENNNRDQLLSKNLQKDMEESGKVNENIKQYLTIMDDNDIIASLYSLIQSLMKKSTYKIIVFFPTAKLTSYFAYFFNEYLLVKVSEIHSRMSQNQRNKVSDEFRKLKNIILFSSDLSARGLDYPGITSVIQMNLVEKETYIHRIGRTGRGISSTGDGYLIIFPWEYKIMNLYLKDFDIKEVKTQELISSISSSSISLDDAKEKVSQLISKPPSKSSELYEKASQTYQAWLGFYVTNANKLGLSKAEVVALALKFLTSISNITEAPALDNILIGKMNLRGVPGINISTEPRVKHHNRHNNSNSSNSNKNQTNTNSNSNKNSHPGKNSSKPNIFTGKKSLQTKQ